MDTQIDTHTQTDKTDSINTIVSQPLCGSTNYVQIFIYGRQYEKIMATFYHKNTITFTQKIQ